MKHEDLRISGGHNGGSGDDETLRHDLGCQPLFLVAIFLWTSEQHTFAVKVYYQNADIAIRNQPTFM